jgi:GNAT superfamily N-acetyltransferase
MKEKYIIEKAKIENINDILDIVKDAKELLRKQNTDQWCGDYPNYNTFLEDIKNNVLYVLKDNDIICGVSVISKEIDHNYDNIYEGNWLSNHNDKYVVIHRIAIKKEYYGKNLSKYFFDYALSYALKNNIYSLRVDTHEKNLAMQKALNKVGFIKCGVIYLARNDEGTNKRIAFEKVIK